MFRFLLLIMVLAILLSGCMATKMIGGVSEPNLAEIKPGIQRSVAEEVLGKRLWHVGAANELTYDIYQYEAEKPARPILGVAILFVDVFSFGYGELIDNPQDFEPVKQVAVAYGSQDRVAFVSKPWPIDAVFGPCRRLRSLLPADSGVPASAHPGPVIGLARSTPNTAKLEVDVWWVSVSVDGRELKEKVVELQPGRHEVVYRYQKDEGIATVELLPGRLYRLKRDQFVRYKGDAYFYFIQDVNSGETVYCNPP